MKVVLIFRGEPGSEELVEREEAVAASNKISERKFLGNQKETHSLNKILLP